MLRLEPCTAWLLYTTHIGRNRSTTVYRSTRKPCSKQETSESRKSTAKSGEAVEEMGEEKASPPRNAGVGPKGALLCYYHSKDHARDLIHLDT